MKTIRVIITDDQRLVRSGLKNVLSAASDIEVVAEAVDGDEAIMHAKKVSPDVVLLDIRMPGLDGLAAAQRLRDEVPSCRVVLLTTFDNDQYVWEGLRAGAVGYVLKDAEDDELFRAIRTAANGDVFLQPSIARKVVGEFVRLKHIFPDPSLNVVSHERFTERDLRILRLVASGASNREIAGLLNVAEETVKNYLHNIMTRLAAKNRAHASVKAKELGLI